MQLIHSVFKEDYDLMHKRFGHPSKDVLKRAKEHTSGFPKGIEIPSDNRICPECAQGKMPSKSYPISKSRAKKPFEKIHLDLKSFPVVSYHKYKYFMSLVDDYSSFSWIVLLRAKSAANSALKQFLAMVLNQYGTTIKEWMSDAGGE